MRKNKVTYLVHIVLVEGLVLHLGEPETHVFVAHRVLAVGYKLVDFSILELGGKTHVFAPEQANVRNVKQHHGKAFQA